MKRRTTVLLMLALLPSSPAFGQQGTGRIVGQVTSEGGAPLAGANVVIVGTQIGTLADQDGRYALPGVPAGTHQVQASLIGYATQTMTVTVGAGGTAEANFRLAPQAIALDEVVAVGYGTQRKRDLTGAVASVRGEDLTVRAAPTTAISNALQGKAPGIQVVTNSGIPGAGARVRIRGTQSITANSEPLYVIDGIPALQGTSSSDPTYNPLNTIDPSEIESIEVLKDASSTAIYGARGANGVVLITTKRGNRGGNQVTLETSYGIQQVTKRIDPLTGPQFLELVNEAYVNSGREPKYTPDQIASAPTYNYVALMLQDAPQQSHTLTFSGGDERTRYLISGNFVNQEGILIRSGFRRYGARVNLDRTISDRFRIGTSVSFTRMRQDLNRTDNGSLGTDANGILGATNFDPTLPPKDENGRWNLRAVLGEQLENPLANSMEIENPRQVSRLLGNAYAEFDVLPTLTLRTTFGANLGFERTPEFRPSTSPAGSSNNGWASVYSNQGLELTSENTATYRREVGPGSLEVLGGFSVQVSHFEDQYTAVRDFPSDEFKWNNLGVARVRESSSTNAVDWALVSFLGRVNYNLKDRYLFTVTGRRDGSSRFGKNNKWAFFPSAAFAWRVIEEDFMRDQQLFSDLKLRLSYGVTGNQAVSEYQSLARLSTVWVGIGKNSEVPTQAPSGAAPNPNLKWETQRQFNVGADLGFLGNRVVVTLDAYQSKTSDLLLSVDLPRISGYSSQLQNVGSVQNRGIELGISTVNIDRQNFSWRSTLNLAANRNKVLELGGREWLDPGTSRYGWFIGNVSSHIVMVGQPLGSFYGYQVDGLYQEGDPCPLSEPRPYVDCVPGEYKVRDVNGDGKIDASDRTIIGNAEPTFYGGFTNNLRYGPFTLDAFMTFSYGNEVANLGRVFTGLATGFLNESEEVLKRWTPQNRNTTIPRANNARPRWFYSTLVEDGSFLRLQSLTLGYQLPPNLIPGASSARLYLTGQNLFVLTNYSGYDPEVNSIGGDSRFGGVDVGAFPRARTWNIGANITF